MSIVKVYSTPTCPYCIRLKEYLKQHNVVFENIDVSFDQKGLQEMIDASGQMGVPVVKIDSDIIIGFDQERIDEKLGL
jgi:glutaredoxin-like YruB-family protein